MNGYHNLTEEEIIDLRNCLIKPNLVYPHYLPLVIDDIIIQEYFDINPLKGETFFEKNISRRDGKKILFVSNYGRILYNENIIKPYVVGTFLHCLKIYHKDFGDWNVYNLVKETIDPIENRSNYEIHHINNNALDNRIENLIWVTEAEHRKIDNEFNVYLRQLSTTIHKNNKKELIELFNSGKKQYYTGNDILLEFPNIYCEVIKYNIGRLVEDNIVKSISYSKSFEDNKYELMVW
jgi:hypothetical protein